MKALILGGIAPHIELISNLKKRGYFVILLDYLENPPAKKYADKYYRVSTLDKEDVLQVAKDEGVDLIITICVDHANVTMCYVAEALNLPHPYSSEIADITTDKVKMKQRMIDGGIPTSSFTQVSSYSEIDAETLRFPVVVKPADNNGSKGVCRVDSAEDLKEAFENALVLSRSRSVVVEGFSRGREIQVDCFANNGKAHIISVKEKLKPKNPEDLPMQSIGSRIPPRISPEAFGKLDTIAQNVVNAFGLEHTPFFFQAMVYQDEINVIELSPRIGGGLSYNMLKRLTDFDIIDAAVQSYFGNIRDVEFKNNNLSMLTCILYASEGVFDRMTGIEELTKENVIESFDLMTERFHVYEGHTDSRGKVGAYIITAKDPEELEEKIRIAKEQIDVLDPDGNSILRKELYEY